MMAKKNNYSLLFCLVVFVQVLFAQDPNTSFDEFLGVNWQNPEKFDDLDCVGFIRDFHVWDSSQDPNGNLYPEECLDFNPTNGLPLDLDYVYGQLDDKGIDISPAMMYSIAPYYGEGQPRTRVPVQWGIVGINSDSTFQWGALESRDSSGSYVERADWMYHFLSRYAPSLNDDVDINNLKYCETEDNTFAQGSVRYIESWNEPDNIYWHPLPNFSTEINGGAFTPKEYVAMASMDYDAHENTIKSKTGDGTEYYAGVKNLSKDVKFVMAAPYAMRYEWGDFEGGFIPCKPNGEDCVSVVEHWVDSLYYYLQDTQRGYFLRQASRNND